MSDEQHSGLVWWRSSSLRLTLLLTIVLWGAAALVASRMYQFSEAALVSRASAEVQELTDWIEELAARPYPPASLMSEAFDNAGAELIEMDVDGSFRQFLEAYTREINRQLREYRQEDDHIAAEFMTARLWLLGEPTAFAPAATTPDSLLELMTDEIPERFHESALTLAEGRLESWPADQRWLRMSDYERVQAVIEFEELDNPAHCIGWLNAEGELTDSNVELVRRSDIAANGFRLVHVNAGNWETPEDLEPASCWMRSVPFDNGRLYFGVRFDAAADLIGGLRAARNGGLLLMLIGAIVAATLLAWLILRRLRHINDTFAAVTAGDLGARVPASVGNDDFSRLARNINASLDRIEHLMSGVRAVSDNIAHDLRTPLTRLRNRVEMLQQPGGADITVIEAVTDEADRLLDTFNALLRIAQLEQGSYRRAFGEFDLRAAVADAVELYEPSITTAGLELLRDLTEEPLPFFGDRDLWMQALSNLFDNALKYTPTGGSIEVSLSRSGAGWRLSMADTGPGIPASERERVLQRFYRLESHRGTEGSGLGLSLVAAVCKLHHAELTLGGDAGLIVNVRWQPASD